ncbi:hypothetical protein [Halorubrum sp. DTA46]|uniref:hypothetical protein n=1 Tax=Halorubrum sp. DTA46 TaxID=3402162 RepID=UPI003AAA4033
MSGSGEILDDDLRESDDVNYGEEDTLALGSEASSLLSNPRGYIREIVLGVFVGGLLSALTFAVQLGLDITAMFRGVLERSGSAVLGNMDSIWSTLATLVALPLETVEGVAASAGPLAPLVTALAFALTAAIVAGIVWGIYRVVRFI